VVEISSYQLDGTKTFRPEIGILLNITPDHLDRYDYKMENYINSKFRLMQQYDGKNTFIYYADDSITGTEVSKRKIEASKIPVSLKDKSTLAHYDGEQMVFRFKFETLLSQLSRYNYFKRTS
jgi:UDP-N-acetylmuramoylalanine--D-glutamate ligase